MDVPSRIANKLTISAGEAGKHGKKPMARIIEILPKNAAVTVDPPVEPESETETPLIQSARRRSIGASAQV